MSRQGLANGGNGGFTWVEFAVVLAIVALLASIGVPQYLAALHDARIDRARHELVGIAHAVERFAAQHDGRLPLTLYQIGYGGARDPWGTPYCYLNHRDGVGDGLDWTARLGPVAGGPVPATGLGDLAARLGRPLNGRDRKALEAVVVENGDFAMYAGVATDVLRRRARSQFPINTDYDLFSLGPDRETAPSLQSLAGHDDVLRGNNGGYFGTAAEY